MSLVTRRPQIIRHARHKPMSRHLRRVFVQAQSSIQGISESIFGRLSSKENTIGWLSPHCDGRPLGYLATPGTSGYRELFIEMRLNDQPGHRLRWNGDKCTAAASRSLEPITPSESEKAMELLSCSLQRYATRHALPDAVWNPTHRCHMVVLPPNEAIHGHTPLALMIYFVFPIGTRGSKLWFDKSSMSGLAPITSSWLIEHLANLQLLSLE